MGYSRGRQCTTRLGQYRHPYTALLAMVASPEVTRRILAKEGIAEPLLLGTGIGSQVFDRADGTVVKVHGGVDGAELEELRRFYERLAEYRFTFAVPRIREIGRVGGTYYTVERRLPGRMLSAVLPRTRSGGRRDLLERYLLAAEQIGQVTWPGRMFGQVLGREKTRARTWRGFVERMVERGLARGAPYLCTDLGSVRPIEEFFEREMGLTDGVEARTLVHGDYWGDNVLVDEVGGRLDVSAVLDFDGMTMVGDWRADVAAAVVFLEMRKGYPRRDSNHLLARAVERYGPSISPVIRFYRLWYAAVYAHVKPFDPLTYGWCLQSFRRELGAGVGTAKVKPRRLWQSRVE